MLRVLNCLQNEHDATLVALAVAVCLLASLTVIVLARRAIVSRQANIATWATLTGLAAGSGIWATHFIAMLAFAPGFPVAFDAPLTVLSLFCAILICTPAFYCVIRRPSPTTAFACGAAVGVGIAAMHFIGMYALVVPGQILWSLDLAAVSVASGILLSIVSLWALQASERLLSTIISAALLAMAILSHHFIAMGAITVVGHDVAASAQGTIAPTSLSLAIAGIVLLLLAMFVLPAVSDLRTSERLLERESQLDAAVDNMSQGLCMFDAVGTLLVVNRRYLGMYSLSPEVAKPGCSLLELIRHRRDCGSFVDDPEEYCEKVLRSVKENEVSSWTIENSGGRTFEVVTRRVKNGGWVTTHEDITEKRAREDSFQLLFSANPVPMWVYDTETLDMLAVNDAAIAHYGYSREQFLSKTVLELRPEAIRETSRQFIERIARHRSNKAPARHKRADGTQIDVEVYAQALAHNGRSARLVAIHDVTDRHKAEFEVRKTKKFLEDVIDNVPMPIMVKDATGHRFTLMNKAASALFGVPRDDMIGKSPHDIYPNDRADFVVSSDNQALVSEEPLFIAEHVISLPDHSSRWVTTKKVGLAAETGEKTHILTVLQDVTTEREAQQRIEFMAHHDALTGLPNRAAFNDALEVEIRDYNLHQVSFALLCMDLDGFKEVNDAYGHSVGDALLAQVAKKLSSAAPGHFIGRLGGDEFVSLGKVDRIGADELAQAFIRAMAEEFIVGDHRLKVGISIGIAMHPDDAGGPTGLMQNADTALYLAKEESRGSVRFFESEMAARLRERASIQKDIEVAIKKDGLVLHYQPQFDMKGTAVGMEALIRWNCPRRGVVPPSTFIPIIERSSLILPLGEFVLRQACSEAAKWPSPVRVAVNISPAQFRHDDFPALVHQVLLETGLGARRLELEITESVLIDDMSRAVSILRRLKLLGVQIALDDFGTGYSSLSYLHAFPFDRIKIDRSFIADLSQNAHSMAIVRAVIGLAKSLKIPVLAEGVETEAEYRILNAEGCDEVQGYLTGRPQPIETYAAIISGSVSTVKPKTKMA